MKISKFLLVASLLTTQNLSAQVAKIQPDSELTVVGVILGKTTLKEVKEKFKAKEIYQEGDAGSSLYALCFKTSTNTTIAFESGEMGGAEHVIHSVSINSAQNPYKLKQICEKTSMIKSKIVLNGISLGMSPDIVKKLVGTPTKNETNKIEYKYAVQVGSKDTTSEMIIEFKDSMSNKITASKLESL